jgi:tetratricopeptide (TPR) repeat protein
MAELRTLPGDLAEVVARLLVATGSTDDPALAYAYAKEARNLAARVGVVRETSAIAAYQAGEWSAALTEFRAARRLTGRDSYLPLMADCERALGRLDRALDLVTGPDARNADHHTKIELRIVESGVRRDQGLFDAAVVVLQIPELTEGRAKPAYARLYYAYADALLAAGREDEAREWFGKAAAADVDDETDAAERCDELDDIQLEDLDLTDEDDDGDDLDEAEAGDDGDDLDVLDEAEADAEVDDDETDDDETDDAETDDDEDDQA